MLFSKKPHTVSRASCKFGNDTIETRTHASLCSFAFSRFRDTIHNTVHAISITQYAMIKSNRMICDNAMDRPCASLAISFMSESRWMRFSGSFNFFKTRLISSNRASGSANLLQSPRKFVSNLLELPRNEERFGEWA